MRLKVTVMLLSPECLSPLQHRTTSIPIIYSFVNQMPRIVMVINKWS